MVLLVNKMEIHEIRGILIKDFGETNVMNVYINTIIKYGGTKSQYKERHHILPKSLYPQYKDCEWNLVDVEYRIHFLLHYLLYKYMCNYEMKCALQCMIAFTKIDLIDSKLYSKIKRYNFDHSTYTPKKKFWDGNKRSHKKGKRLTGYENGLKKLNDENFKCYLDLIDKKYIRVHNNTHKPNHLFLFNGHSIEKIYIIRLYNMYFVFRNNLPKFLKDRTRLIKNKDYSVFLNSSISKINSKWSDYEKEFVSILKNKRLNEIDIEIIPLKDYRYSETHEIIHTEMDLMNGINKAIQTLKENI